MYTCPRWQKDGRGIFPGGNKIILSISFYTEELIGHELVQKLYLDEIPTLHNHGLKLAKQIYQIIQVCVLYLYMEIYVSIYSF